MRGARTGVTVTASGSGPATPGWLMTSVAPWGENPEDAFDQALVELGLGDSRIVRVEGAMLPLGFEPVLPRALPMGSLVECHISAGLAFDGGIASAGAAWASAQTPEGDACAVVATLATRVDAEETEVLVREALRRRLHSRDLEVDTFDVAVDEVTAGPEHHGVALAALVLPESLQFSQVTGTGPVRSASLTRNADTTGIDLSDLGGGKPGAATGPKDGAKAAGEASFSYKAPAAAALRPGAQPPGPRRDRASKEGSDFSM